MERLLFITLGTNKYATLGKECIESFNNNLEFDRNKYKIDYLLLTDRHQLAVWQHIPGNVMVRYTQHLPWPMVTCLRFHIFLTYQELLEEYDYIYFINSDMRCQPGLNLEELLPSYYGLVGVAHPGFSHLPLQSNGLPGGTLENNPQSQFFLEKSPLPQPITNKYVIGAFQGGKREEFIIMCQMLKAIIDIDLQNNIIPRFHDETAWVYYSQLYGVDVLPPTYCQPEIKDNDWPVFGPGPTKILKLRKDHAQIRS